MALQSGIMQGLAPGGIMTRADLKEPVMTFKGTVKNGMVVLEGPGSLPEGTPVSVRPLKIGAGTKKRRSLTLYDGLKPFIGMGKGLPRDGARNIDHYLYGAPKRK